MLEELGVDVDIEEQHRLHSMLAMEDSSPIRPLPQSSYEPDNLLPRENRDLIISDVIDSDNTRPAPRVNVNGNGLNHGEVPAIWISMERNRTDHSQRFRDRVNQLSNEDLRGVQQRGLVLWANHRHGNPVGPPITERGAQGDDRRILMEARRIVENILRTRSI